MLSLLVSIPARVGGYRNDAQPLPESAVWLFVFAIALYNLPEGLTVAMALKATGISPWRAAQIVVVSGLMEPLGALLGIQLASVLALTYPIGQRLAADAMIFVASHEVIPETHSNGHQTHASIWFDGQLRPDDAA